MKYNNKNLAVHPDEQGYKKKYITRKIEEKEADTEIRRFHGEGEAPPREMCDAQNVDEERSVRNVQA